MPDEWHAGEFEGHHFFSMEFVEGKTLREVLSEGPLPTKKLLQLATQIAEGLAVIDGALDIADASL